MFETTTTTAATAAAAEWMKKHLFARSSQKQTNLIRRGNPSHLSGWVAGVLQLLRQNVTKTFEDIIYHARALVH